MNSTTSSNVHEIGSSTKYTDRRIELYNGLYAVFYHKYFKAQLIITSIR